MLQTSYFRRSPRALIVVATAVLVMAAGSAKDDQHLTAEAFRANTLDVRDVTRDHKELANWSDLPIPKNAKSISVQAANMIDGHVLFLRYTSKTQDRRKICGVFCSNEHRVENLPELWPESEEWATPIPKWFPNKLVGDGLETYATLVAKPYLSDGEPCGFENLRITLWSFEPKTSRVFHISYRAQWFRIGCGG